MLKYFLSPSLFILISTITCLAQIKHEVKLNLPELYLKKYQLGYEYKYANRFSIGANFGMALPYTYVFEDADIEDIVSLDKIVYKRYKILPEWRWYPSSKESMRGFFLGVYGRYAHRQLDVIGTILDDKNSFNYDLSLILTTYSIGPEIGFKIPMGNKERLAFDFVFGYGGSWYKLKLKDNSNLDQQINQKVDEFLGSEVTEILDYMEFNRDVNYSYEQTIATFTAVDIRAAISLGIRF